MFVGSLRKAGFTGDIALSVSPEKEMKRHVAAYLKNQHVLAYPFKFTCGGPRGRKLLVTPGGCVLDDWYRDRARAPLLAISRYEMYETWLRQYSAESYVLDLDTRDTFFQADPFLPLAARRSAADHARDLYVFEEDGLKTTGTCKWNKGWLRCFEAAKWHTPETDPAPAPTRAAPRRLRAARLGVVHTIGAMNGNSAPMELLGPLDTKWKVRDPVKGFITNTDGSRSPVVHQWDRWAGEMKTFLTKAFVTDSFVPGKGELYARPFEFVAYDPKTCADHPFVTKHKKGCDRAAENADWEARRAQVLAQRQAERDAKRQAKAKRSSLNSTDATYDPSDYAARRQKAIEQARRARPRKRRASPRVSPPAPAGADAAGVAAAAARAGVPARVPVGDAGGAAADAGARGAAVGDSVHAEPLPARAGTPPAPPGTPPAPPGTPPAPPSPPPARGADARPAWNSSVGGGARRASGEEKADADAIFSRLLRGGDGAGGGAGWNDAEYEGGGLFGMPPKLKQKQKREGGGAAAAERRRRATAASPGGGAAVDRPRSPSGHNAPLCVRRERQQRKRDADAIADREPETRRNLDKRTAARTRAAAPAVAVPAR
ncbi:hypothetical protein JL720_15656 [Aureococcus anophagefferens]|nr:hypothetical protein JL720_15656 [Aureococcus anophagefferens]